jgi:hypothetical protein
MDPLNPPPTQATCTTCTFADDFSNYWTAVLYFRARNGSYHRVPQKPNVGFEQAKGGMTIYYIPCQCNRHCTKGVKKKKKKKKSEKKRDKKES